MSGLVPMCRQRQMNPDQGRQSESAAYKVRMNHQQGHSSRPSLHHQYSSRTVTGWTQVSDMRSQAPSFGQLPSAFQQPLVEEKAVVSPYGNEFQSWSFGQATKDCYNVDDMSAVYTATPPYSDISSPPYTDLLTPPITDFFGGDISPGAGCYDSPQNNVFDYDFGSHMSNTSSPTMSDMSMYHSYPSPQYSISPPSSVSSTPSPTTRYFDIPDPSTCQNPLASSTPSRGRVDELHDPKRRFPCQVPGCSRRFTSQYTLKVHTEAHKPKPRTSFPCQMGCSERFSRQHDRLRHEVAKHGKVCEHSCKECGRFFSNHKTLGNHKCPAAQSGTRWVVS